MTNSSGTQPRKREWMDVIKGVISYAIPKTPSWYLSFLSRSPNEQQDQSLQTVDTVNDRCSEPLSAVHREALLENLRRVDLQRSLSLKRSLQFNYSTLARPPRADLSTWAPSIDPYPSKIAKTQQNESATRIQCHLYNSSDEAQKSLANRSLPSYSKYTSTAKRLFNATMDSKLLPDVEEKRRKFENINDDYNSKFNRRSNLVNGGERYTFRKPPSLFDPIDESELVSETNRLTQNRNDNAILAALASLPKKKSINAPGIYNTDELSVYESSPDTNTIRTIVREEMERLHRKITTDENKSSGPRWTCVSCFSLIDSSLNICPICNCTRNPAGISSAYSSHKFVSSNSTANCQASPLLSAPQSSLSNLVSGQTMPLCSSSSNAQVSSTNFTFEKNALSTSSMLTSSISSQQKIGQSSFTFSTPITVTTSSVSQPDDPLIPMFSMKRSYVETSNAMSTVSSSAITTSALSFNFTSQPLVSQPLISQTSTTVSQSVPQFSFKLPSVSVSTASSTALPVNIFSQSHNVFSHEKPDKSVVASSTNQKSLFLFSSSADNTVAKSLPNQQSQSSTVKLFNNQMPADKPSLNISTTNYENKPSLSFNLTSTSKEVNDSISTPSNFTLSPMPASIDNPEKSISNMFPSKFSFGSNSVSNSVTSSSSSIFNANSSFVSTTNSSFQLSTKTQSGMLFQESINESNIPTFDMTSKPGSVFPKQDNYSLVSSVSNNSNLNSSFPFVNHVTQPSVPSISFSPNAQLPNIFNTMTDTTSSSSTLQTSVPAFKSSTLFGSSTDQFPQSTTAIQNSVNLFGKNSAPQSTSDGSPSMFKFGSTGETQKPYVFQFGLTSNTSSSNNPVSFETKSSTPFIFGASSNTPSDSSTIFGAMNKTNPPSLFVFSGKSDSTGSLPSFGSTMFTNSASTQQSVNKPTFTFPTANTPDDGSSKPVNPFSITNSEIANRKTKHPRKQLANRK